MATQRLTSRRRQDQGSKWVRIVMAVLATVGVIDTGSITLKFWGVLGDLTCPMGAGGCDKVLNSPWGTLFQGDGFSIPLSFAGLIAYLAVLVMAVVPLLPGLSENKADLSRRTWWGLFTVSLVMAVFSLVLVGLMVIKIQAFCFSAFFRLCSPSACWCCHWLEVDGTTPPNCCFEAFFSLLPCCLVA